VKFSMVTDHKHT